MRLTEEQKAELKRAAMALDGETWHVGTTGGAYRHVDGGSDQWIVPPRAEVSGRELAHIVAANPAAVIALLEENAAQAKQLRETMDAATDLRRGVERQRNLANCRIISKGPGWKAHESDCRALLDACAAFDAFTSHVVVTLSSGPTPETAARLRAVDMLKEVSKPPQKTMRLLPNPSCGLCGGSGAVQGLYLSDVSRTYERCPCVDVPEEASR